MPKRYYCTFCNKRRSALYMSEVYYKLLDKTAFHCTEHLSTTEDILQIRSKQKKSVFLELFAGSQEISKAAAEYSYTCYGVDIEKKYCASICSDILTLNLNQLPKNIDFIWASIPCTTYSILSLDHHWNKITYAFRKYYYYPKTPEAKKAIQILEKTLSIIRSVAPRVFVIENPRGALRHMPQMQSIPFRHTVSYADYGTDYYKPTDLFTNYPSLKLKEISTSVGQNFAGSVVDLKNPFERSKIPGLLIHEILKQTKQDEPTFF